MRENLIETRLISRVLEEGGITRKVQWVGRRGAPDRVVLLPGGVIIWVECKSPEWGKLEDHQEREIERLRRMGQRVEVVDTYEKIEELFR